MPYIVIFPSLIFDYFILVFLSVHTYSYLTLILIFPAVYILYTTGLLIYYAINNYYSIQEEYSNNRITCTELMIISNNIYYFYSVKLHCV